MSELGHKKNVPEFIVTTEGEVLGKDTSENREIVRRIHACVNACQDISTDELEKGIVSDMRKVLSEVVPYLEGQKVSLEDLTIAEPHYDNCQHSELNSQKQKFFG